MFNDIQIKPNESTDLSLFDTHDITINRGVENNAEIVIHPCNIGKLTIRYAKEPYCCKLFLADGTEREVDLWDENDWGNIQQMNPYDWFKEGNETNPEDFFDRIGWGNDADGHIEIVKVELLNGVPHGTEIPLKEFRQDVHDFLIYHEN